MESCYILNWGRSFNFLVWFVFFFSLQNTDADKEKESNLLLNISTAWQTVPQEEVVKLVSIRGAVFLVRLKKVPHRELIYTSENLSLLAERINVELEKKCSILKEGLR